MKRNDPLLSVEDAINRLPDRQQIHMFFMLKGKMVGMTQPKSEVVSKIMSASRRESGNTESKQISHDLIILTEGFGNPIWIETVES